MTTTSETTTATGHTPGPWCVYRQHRRVSSNGAAIYADEGRLFICSVVGEANAVLIAAVTDLLEVCEAIVEKENVSLEVYAMAHAAIAKAKGQQ